MGVADPPANNNNTSTRTSCTHENMSLSDVISYVSIESSNETASDLPGAGRTLGNVYSKLGRKLEGALVLAVRSNQGKGPSEIARKIMQLRSEVNILQGLHSGDRLPGLFKKLKKDCRALLEYTTCVAQSDC